MKTFRILMLVVLTTVALFSQVAIVSALTFSVTYNDVTTNIGQVNPPYAINTSQNATVNVAECMYDCWIAKINNPFLFSYNATIELPKVGETINGGYVDQTFYDTTKTHEDWHYNYIIALANSTYGALETWSASYVSNLFETSTDALNSGNLDLSNALTVALNAYNNDINTDVNIYEPAAGTYAHRVDLGGVLTWRSVNPDWGQPAVDYANNINVSFEKLPGDATCIPEPSTCIFLVTGIAGLVGTQLRRKTAVNQKAGSS